MWKINNRYRDGGHLTLHYENFINYKFWSGCPYYEPISSLWDTVCVKIQFDGHFYFMQKCYDIHFCIPASALFRMTIEPFISSCLCLCFPMSRPACAVARRILRLHPQGTFGSLRRHWCLELSFSDSFLEISSSSGLWYEILLKLSRHLWILLWMISCQEAYVFG